MITMDGYNKTIRSTHCDKIFVNYFSGDFSKKEDTLNETFFSFKDVLKLEHIEPSFVLKKIKKTNGKSISLAKDSATCNVNMQDHLKPYLYVIMEDNLV